MAFKKRSENRKLVFDVSGEQPVESGSVGGQKMDPRAVVVLVDDGKLTLVNVEGVLFNQNGKLGKKNAMRLFVEESGSPKFVNDILAAESIAWPPRDEDEDEVDS